MSAPFLDIRFPTGGVDISDEFSVQRPGTTPIGTNVRAFEPSTQRARGGARPGLMKWMPAAMAAAEVQNLDTIVTTTLLADAVQPTAPSSTVGSTVITVLDRSDPQAQTRVSEGDYPDPSNGTRKLLADGSVRRVRTGGSGYYTHASVLPKTISDGTTTEDAGLIQFAAVKGLNVLPGNPIGFVLPFQRPIVKKNLLVAIVAACQDDDSDPGITVTDALGHTWHLSGIGVAGETTSGDSTTQVFLGIYTTEVTTEGADSVTITADTAIKAWVAELWPGFGTSVAYQQTLELRDTTAGAVDYPIPLTGPSVSFPSLVIAAWLIATPSVSAVTSNLALVVDQHSTADIGIGLCVAMGVVQPGTPATAKITVTKPGAVDYAIAQAIAIGGGT